MPMKFVGVKFDEADVARIDTAAGGRKMKRSEFIRRSVLRVVEADEDDAERKRRANPEVPEPTQKRSR